MEIPADYRQGQEKARAFDPELSQIYLRNTLVGDPISDAAMEALAKLSPGKSSPHKIISACMEQDKEGMREAPAELREFFEFVSSPPDHVVIDPETAKVAAHAFFKNSDLIVIATLLDAHISGLVEGIGRMFNHTGRATGNTRRLRQNARHILDIFMPGGLERTGDGWKLSVRIRLIHSQVRRLIEQSDSGDWDTASVGRPLHMAHLALGTCGFSTKTISAARKLGADLTEEDGEAYMRIWRYAGWLMGLPDELLRYFESEEKADHLRKLAMICEPPPCSDAVIVAGQYFDAIPILANMHDPKKQKKFTSALYRLSRALVGDRQANALGFPNQSTFGVLELFKAQQKMKRVAARVFPGVQPFAFTNYVELLDRSIYDDAGISYRMPDAVKESATTPW